MNKDFFPFNTQREFLPNICIPIKNVYIDGGNVIIPTNKIDLFKTCMIHLERKICIQLWSEPIYSHHRVIMEDVLPNLHVFNVIDGTYNIILVLFSISFEDDFASFVFHLCYNIEIDNLKTYY